jgi:hypothetical protein
MVGVFESDLTPRTTARTIVGILVVQNVALLFLAYAEWNTEVLYTQGAQPPTHIV